MKALFFSLDYFLSILSFGSFLSFLSFFPLSAFLSHTPAPQRTPHRHAVLLGIMLYYAKQPTSKRAAPPPFSVGHCLLYYIYPTATPLYHSIFFPILPSFLRTHSLSVPLRHGYNPRFRPPSFTHPGDIPTRSSSIPAFQLSPMLSVSFLLALRSPRMRFSISDDKFIA